MSEYLLTIVGTTLFSSIIVAILPSGKTSELIKAIARTACLAVILSPIVTLFVDAKNYNGIFVESGIQLHQNFIEYSCERRIQETEGVLLKDLDGRFDGISFVAVSCESQTVDWGGYSVEEIRVTDILVETEYSFSEMEIQAVRDYLWNSYGCECSIITATK